MSLGLLSGGVTSASSVSSPSLLLLLLLPSGGGSGGTRTDGRYHTRTRIPFRDPVRRGDALLRGDRRLSRGHRDALPRQGLPAVVLGQAVCLVESWRPMAEPSGETTKHEHIAHEERVQACGIIPNINFFPRRYQAGRRASARLGARCRRPRANRQGSSPEPTPTDRPPDGPAPRIESPPPLSQPVAG